MAPAELLGNHVVHSLPGCCRIYKSAFVVAKGLTVFKGILCLMLLGYTQGKESFMVHFKAELGLKGFE